MANDFLTLKEAVAFFLTRPHKNTVVRWAERGIYGVRLKTVRYAGKRLTRRLWIDQFNKAVMGASPDSYAETVEPSAAAKSAEEKLDAMGIGVAKTPRRSRVLEKKPAKKTRRVRN